ncbi:MAG: hypothetical protein ACRDHK_07270 [Actinomycetota bacterium]
MPRAIRDPRLRLVLLLVVVALALLLSWHLLAAGGIHGMAMMLGLCVAFLAVATALLIPGRPVIAVATVSPSPTVDPTRRERIEPIGRHPPDEGIRLRH